MPEKYRRKPTEILTVRWTGDNLQEVIAFTGQHESAQGMTWSDYEELVRRKGLKLFTREGAMMASIGDWIILDVAGYPYACKPDHFEENYEPVANK